MDYEKCSITSQDAVIVVKENKSRFEVKNPNGKKIRKIQVDGCLIGNSAEKCDWIIEILSDTPEKPSDALFVELKGCDINKAISQLKSTLTQTAHYFRDHRKHCYAVTSRIPKHGTCTRKIALDFHRETNVTLGIKNQINSIKV